MFTSLVISGSTTVTTAAVVGISNSMAPSAALLVKLTVHFIWHQGAGKNLHRHRHIEGHCNNIHKGKVRVGFWVGSCNNGHKLTDADTGWTTMSRIFIEEVGSAQQ